MRYLVKTYLGNPSDSSYLVDHAWYNSSDFGFISSSYKNIMHAIWGYNVEYVDQTSAPYDAAAYATQKTNLFGYGNSRSLWHSRKYSDSKYDNSWMDTNYFLSMTHETINNVNSIHPYHDATLDEAIDKVNTSDYHVYYTPMTSWMLDARNAEDTSSHLMCATLSRSASDNVKYESRMTYFSNSRRFLYSDFDNLYEAIGNFGWNTMESASDTPSTEPSSEFNRTYLSHINFNMGSVSRSFAYAFGSDKVSGDETNDIQWNEGMSFTNWASHDNLNPISAINTGGMTSVSRSNTFNYPSIGDTTVYVSINRIGGAKASSDSINCTESHITNDGEKIAFSHEVLRIYDVQQEDNIINTDGSTDERSSFIQSNIPVGCYVVHDTYKAIFGPTQDDTRGQHHTSDEYIDYNYNLYVI